MKTKQLFFLLSVSLLFFFKTGYSQDWIKSGSNLYTYTGVDKVSVGYSTSTYLQDKFSVNGDGFFKGNLGIGKRVSDPLAKLEIYGQENPKFILRSPEGKLEIGVASCNGCYSNHAVPGDVVFRGFGSGNLIFTTPYLSNSETYYFGFADANGMFTKIMTDRTLRVDGTIYAKEMRVQTNVWADFVFSEDYKLPALSEVKAHIEEHKHLPGVPSEAEVLKNGISVTETSALLLQKIEELTLYTLQQQEQIEKQNDRINELEQLLNPKY